MKIECIFNNKKFYFETNNKKLQRRYKSMEIISFIDLITNKKVTIFKNPFNKITLKQIK